MALVLLRKNKLCLSFKLLRQSRQTDPYPLPTSP